ncbi:helix-turn-helix domain-containing protein [Agromyces sp. MMS24-K17]|uniref:helix-turn-helix domain-containing protein n=1 Tax=Agromyces sp. MMS24-K17 TaxID=3372850 RepID=UPI0037547C87
MTGTASAGLGPTAEPGPTDEAPDAVAARLGAHVRRLRLRRGDTLVQVAERTGLSHPFLSQVERGLAQPSLSSLRRIAVALGTSPIELVAAAEDRPHTVEHAVPPFEVHRRGDRPQLAAGFADGDARMLAHSDRPFHPIEFTGSDAEPGPSYVHDEDEFVLVTRGTVVIELDGRRDLLDEGDAVYYAGGVPHRWWAAAGEYRLLIVKERPRV